MRQLGQLETAIMQRLWAWGRPASVREVLEDLRRERPLAYTTVMTVMDNLHSKGVLRRDKRGRAYVYVPTLSHDEHNAALLEQVLVESDDRRSVLLHLVERLTPAEAAELLAALNEAAEEDAR